MKLEPSKFPELPIQPGNQGFSRKTQLIALEMSETYQNIFAEHVFIPDLLNSPYRCTLRRSIIVPGGANNESRGGPGGPGTGFCSSGGGFLVLVAVVACHYVYYH